MTPSISVSELTMERLKAHAIPFEDTPETVIGRALDALVAAKAGTKLPQPEPLIRAFNPAAPPSLLHTTPKQITFNGKTFTRGETYWNHLMQVVIREAYKKLANTEEVYKMLVVPAVIGKKDDSGYTFYEDVGLSVQGQDSNGAWKQIYTIVSKLGFKLRVDFHWQDKEKAAMPNTDGSMTID